MLESLTLVNFQKHRRLTIQFDPQITSIIGPTDAGKSAILRGIRWVALNRPSGDGNRRRGSSSTKCKLQIDGHTIIRKRGDENSYIIDGKRLVSFRDDVPEEIADLLRVSEVNFLDQHDPPFWFKESPSQVARELNRIVDLGDIDRVLSNIASQLRQARSEAEVSRKRLAEAMVSRDSLSWVPEAEERLKALAEVEKGAEAKRKKATALRVLLGDATTLAERKRNTASARTGALTAVKAGDRLRRSEGRLASLRGMVQELSRLMELVRRHPPDVSELERLRKHWQQTLKRRDSLKSLYRQLKQEEEKLCQAQEEKNRVEQKILEGTAGRCPVCGNPLSQ